jgi:PHD/YefM family antitoxin component YafN of YafNO toxin-antitoxin module
MDTLVRVQADELNSSLIDFIKSTFKGKKVAVHIYEDEMDETEYLLSDPQHRKELLESVAKVKQAKNLKAYTLDEIQSLLNEPEP